MRVQPIPFVAHFGNGLTTITKSGAMGDQSRLQVYRCTSCAGSHYLKSTGYRLGLLAIFGAHGEPQHERIVR
jgi:hypothetical protein